MKTPIVLAGLIVVASGTLVVAQQANRAHSRSQLTQAAQSAPKDQKAKTQQDKPPKGQEGKQPETPKFSKEQIMKVQKALQRYDYYDGPIDGKLSPELRQAIKDFQEDEGLEATGELDEETHKRILALQEEGAGEEPPSRL